MPTLAELSRPKAWSEVIGQSKVIRKIDRLRPRGLAGRGWWINGQSGTGKTTIARLLASEVAKDFATDEVDAQSLTPSRIDDIDRQIRGKPLGGQGWAHIVNEAHGMSKTSIRRLLTLFDHLPDWSTWLFTTTIEGQQKFDDMDDGGPLLSRCTRLDLSRQGLAPLFAKHAQGIADRLGLNGKPEQAYLRLVQDCRNNLRAVLNAIEAGEMME